MAGCQSNRLMTAFRWFLLPALLAFTACSPGSSPQQPALSAEARQWSDELIHKLNAYRTQKGLKPLQHHRGLDELCLNHSDWLRRKRGSSFLHGSHVSHYGSGARARQSRIQYGMEAWGENVAYISNTPQDPAGKLMVMWKGSPSHHKAMVGDWTHVGAAISVDKDGAIFSTMNFGRKKSD